MALSHRGIDPPPPSTTMQWVDGTTLDSALVGWLFNDDGRSSRLFIDTTPGPNNPNCTAPTLSA